MIMVEKIMRRILGDRRSKKNQRSENTNKYLKPERRKVQRRKR